MGHPAQTWPVRSELQSVSGLASAVTKRPAVEAVGKRGVMKFGLRGLPDKEMVFFVYEESTQPASNVLMLRKKDFVVGDDDAVYTSAVAKLCASEQSGKKVQLV